MNKNQKARAQCKKNHFFFEPSSIKSRHRNASASCTEITVAMSCCTAGRNRHSYILHEIDAELANLSASPALYLSPFEEKLLGKLQSERKKTVLKLAKISAHAGHHAPATHDVKEIIEEYEEFIMGYIHDMPDECFEHEVEIDPGIWIDIDDHDSLDNEKRTFFRLRSIYIRGFWKYMYDALLNRTGDGDVGMQIVSKMIWDIRTSVEKHASSVPCEADEVKSLINDETMQRMMAMDFDQTCKHVIRRLIEILEFINTCMADQLDRGNVADDKRRSRRQMRSVQLINARKRVDAVSDRLERAALPTSTAEHKAAAFCKAMEELWEQRMRMRSNEANIRILFFRARLETQTEDQKKQTQEQAMEQAIRKGCADMQTSTKWVQEAVFRCCADNPSSETRESFFDEVVNTAWMDAIIERDIDIRRKPGEILLFDRKRLAKLRGHFDACICIQSILDTMDAATGTKNRALNEEIAQSLFHSKETTIQALTPIAIGMLKMKGVLSEPVLKCMEEKLLLVNSTDASSIVEQNRRSLRSSCIQFFTERSSEMLQGIQKQQKQMPPTIQQQPTDCFAREMKAHIELLLRMIAISKRDHAKWYREMVSSALFAVHVQQV